jgi:hypothetical protein
VICAQQAPEIIRQSPECVHHPITLIGPDEVKVDLADFDEKLLKNL